MITERGKRGRARRTVMGRVVAVLAGLVLMMTGCAIPLPTVQPLTLIDPVEEVQQVSLDGAERAVVRLRLLSDTLFVHAGDEVRDAGNLLQGYFRYNVAEWAPTIRGEVTDDTKQVTVRQGLGSQIPLTGRDRYENAWEIALARGVPLELAIEIGAGDSQLDLTGLALGDLSVTSGSNDLLLTFAAPNPEPLAMLRLTTGTGACVAQGLGHANFDQVVVSGGAGTVDLDFGGTMWRSAVAEVRAGAGRVTIRVPHDVGVRATLAGTPLGTVDTVGFSEPQERVYVNAAYGEAIVTLTLRITAGAGTVTLISE